MKLKQIALAAAVALGISAPALADVNIGVSVSATGPAAALGIAEKNTAALLPTEIGGEKINWHILDDASDTTTAVTNVRKFISERNVDAIVGSSTTPNSLAMIDVAAEARTPVISLAGSAIVVEPQDGQNNKHWAFKTPQNDELMAGAIAKHMLARGIKTVGFIGFSDAYGEGWYEEARKAIEAAGMEMVASERYGRTDTSVTGQVLKLIALNPDAVLVGASGTPAALPETTLKERGYQGQMYQTHGVAIRDFLRVGGKDVEGTFLPAGPVLVADQLPDSNPVKASALEYIKAYEGKYGAGTVSTFGGHAWDAGRLLQAAIPVALEQAKPGTEEFRVALRDALENVHDVAGAQGVFDMTPEDHTGLDERAVVMVKVENGDWVYQPD